MKQEKVEILNNPGAMQKFCTKENKVFGCQHAYGCTVACPLWRAVQVQYLVNEKGMTIGDAHRVSLCNEVSKPEAIDALRSAVRDTPTVSLRTLINIIEKAYETSR